MFCFIIMAGFGRTEFMDTIRDFQKGDWYFKSLFRISTELFSVSFKNKH